MYPELLQPNAVENIISLSDKKIQITKININFKKWSGEAFKKTYGNKTVLNF
jgi:hypothetical protein